MLSLYLLREILLQKQHLNTNCSLYNLLHKTVLIFFINKLKLITLLFPFRNVWYFVK